MTRSVASRGHDKVSFELLQYLPRHSIRIGYFCQNYCDKKLKLLRHDLAPAWRSLSRFKLSFLQCNLPGVLNCMSGRLSGFDN